MKFVDADMKWVSDCWSGFGLNGAQSTGIGNWLRVYAVIVGDVPINVEKGGAALLALSG